MRNGSTPTSASSSFKPSDVNRLTLFLAEDTTPVSDKKLESPHDIKSHYYYLKTTNQLHRLSPQTLSSLISLFGSLSHLSTIPYQTSLSEEDGHAFHPSAHSLYREFPSGSREHWAFVVNVYKDKRSMGFVLNASDSFWLLRASLQDLKKLAEQKNADSTLQILIPDIKHLNFHHRKLTFAWSSTGSKLLLPCQCLANGLDHS